MVIVSTPKKKILEEIRCKPCHGYILSKKLNIPLASIYEHLKELREKKLIESKIEDRRKIYHLTEKGKMLLKALE